MAVELQSCPHYVPWSGDLPDEHSEIDRTTCEGCGGNEHRGPSCWCPVFGEIEDDA